MPFLLLLILMAASMPVQWPEPWFDLDPMQCVATTGGLVLVFWLLCIFSARRAVSRLSRFGCDPESISNRHDRSRSLLFLGSLGLFTTALFLFGWGWAVTDLLTIRVQEGKQILLPQLGDVMVPSTQELPGQWRLLPGFEMLNLMPFLLMLVGSWFIFYDVERAFHSLSHYPDDDPFWTRWGYVFYKARQFLVMVFVPVILLSIHQGLVRVYPELADSPWMRAASLLMIPFLLLFLPRMLPMLLGWRVLPDGSTRTRLVAHARRLGFRYREIYLWDTRKGMANAMVVGVLPQARYVVFTDRLLHELSEDEVDAVFGHEVGHARHGHLVYYALFLVLSVLTVGALYEVLRKSNWFVGKETQTWLIVGPVLFMGLYMFLVFGFLSRRCERQADLFGCRAGSCHDPNCDRHHDTTPLAPNGIGLCPTGIEAFIRALRRVEEINGMTRTRTEPRRGLLNSVFQWFGVLLVWLQTWQHSTIEKRVAFLRRVRDDLEIERRFQKRVFLIRILILGTLIAVLISVAVLWGSDVLLGAL